jgi:FKBP-type peptidyl-prolyl cis-trans isomerase
MRTFSPWILCCSAVLASVACHDDKDDETTLPPRHGIEQIAPPLDLRTPPGDATKMTSGLIYKTLVANARGEQPAHGDTALLQYTGWRQSTGETFFTTKGRDQPIALDLAHAAPGFAETLPRLHQGEKVVLWVPPGNGTAEAVVYEIEVVGVVKPPGRAKQAGKAQAAAPASPATPPH